MAEALARGSRDGTVLNGLAGQGPVADFELALAGYLGQPFVLAVNSGASALHLALLAAGVGVGDEVIMPAYGWGQALTFIDALDAVPVFADLDPQTLGIAGPAVVARLTERTRAVIVIHQSGHPVDIDPFASAVREVGAVIIEDCAQALGARLPTGQLVGSSGDMSVYSFGPRKHLPLGEGGALATAERSWFERAVLAGQHPDRAALQVLRPGANEFFWPYRLHPLAAVLGEAMLKQIMSWQHQRAVNVSSVLDALRPLDWLTVPIACPRRDHAWCHLPLTVTAADGVQSRDDAVQRLRSCGLPVTEGPVRHPLHMRPEVIARWGAQEPCPLAEQRCQHQELVLLDAIGWVDENAVVVERLIEALHGMAGHER